MAADRPGVHAPDLPVFIFHAGAVEEPVSGEITFDADERARIATFLGILSLDEFTFAYEIAAASNGRLSLRGKITARLTQSCVVTLEPVSETVDEAVEAELRPLEQLEDDEPPQDAPETIVTLDEPPIPITDGDADLAAFAIEILSTSMTPYPRKTGAEFDWRDPAGGPGGAASGPFAELARLKPKI